MIELSTIIVLGLLLIFAWVHSLKYIKNELPKTIHKWQHGIKAPLTFLDATKLLELQLEACLRVRVIRSLTSMLPLIGVLVTAIFAIVMIIYTPFDQIDESDVYPIFFGVGFGAIGAILNLSLVTFLMEARLMSIENAAVETFQGDDFKELIISPSSHIDSVRSSVTKASEDLQRVANNLEKKIDKSTGIYKQITSSARELCEEIGKVSASFKAVNIKRNIEDLNNQVGEFTEVLKTTGKAVQSQTDKSNNVYKGLNSNLKETLDISRTNIESVKMQQQSFDNSRDLVLEEGNKFRGVMEDLDKSINDLKLASLKESLDDLNLTELKQSINNLELAGIKESLDDLNLAELRKSVDDLQGVLDSLIKQKALN